MTNRLSDPLRVQVRANSRNKGAPWWAVVAVSCVVVLGLIALFNGDRTTTGGHIPASTTGQALR
jgi:hypothetical protein